MSEIVKPTHSNSNAKKDHGSIAQLASFLSTKANADTASTRGGYVDWLPNADFNQIDLAAVNNQEQYLWVLQDFDNFKAMQSFAHNLDSIHTLNCKKDPRLDIQSETPDELLYAFLMEYWSHSTQCFCIWVKILNELALANPLRPLLDSVANLYQEAFATTYLSHTLPLLYAITRAYGDFSDEFRQLTGSEWCPMDFTQLEILLTALIADPIAIEVDQMIDRLTQSVPRLKRLAGDTFWARYERQEASYAMHCADWSVSFKQRPINISFLP